MKTFWLMVAICIPLSHASAQTPPPDTASAVCSDEAAAPPDGKPKARLIDSLGGRAGSGEKERRTCAADQLRKELLEGKQSFSKLTVTGMVKIEGYPEGNLRFTDVVFEDELHIGGRIKSLRFERCQFKRNVDFYEVEGESLMVEGSKFEGSVWFNVSVKNFELRKSEFEKIVDFGVTDLQKSSINMTRLLSREPIRIDWDQFGAKWLEGMKSKGTTELGGGDDERARKRNLADLHRELQFWKNNFQRLGHERDAYEVNYEINTLGTEGVRLEPGSFDWFVAKLLSVPNRYGASPYRPLVAGLLVIACFALLYRIADPFVAEDEEKPPRPKRPLLLFSLMYSIDTFIPVVDVTKVRDWGWRVSDGYRWVTVTERLLGLLVFYSATYSLAYYIF